MVVNASRPLGKCALDGTALYSSVDLDLDVDDDFLGASIFFVSDSLVHFSSSETEENNLFSRPECTY